MCLDSKLIKPLLINFSLCANHLVLLVTSSKLPYVRDFSKLADTTDIIYGANVTYFTPRIVTLGRPNNNFVLFSFQERVCLKKMTQASPCSLFFKMLLGQ